MWDGIIRHEFLSGKITPSKKARHFFVNVMMGSAINMGMGFSC